MHKKYSKLQWVGHAGRDTVSFRGERKGDERGLMGSEMTKIHYIHYRIVKE